MDKTTICKLPKPALTEGGPALTDRENFVSAWNGQVEEADAAIAALQQSWPFIQNKPEITVGDTGYADLATILAGNPAAGTTIIVPPGLALANRTIDVNATLPAGVTLKVHQGSPIQISAGKRLTIKGYIADCNHQIFDDLNTYNYATRTITTITGAPSAPVFTLASHGLIEGDQVYFTADTYDHNYANVTDISGATFRLKYPNGTYVTGSFTANNFAIALKEAWGVKFIESTTTHVRPEWWGITSNTATNNISFNHAIHNSYLVNEGTDVTGLLPIYLSAFIYKVEGRLYIISGTNMQGTGIGFGGPFMYKTIIYVYDSDPTVDSFIYVMDMGEVVFRDFCVNAMPSITCSKGFELTAGFWKTNGTKLERISIVGFSDWGLYCAPPDKGMITNLQNCQIGSNGNGIRINTDSEVFNCNFVGNGEGIGIQSSGAQIRNCLLEVWGKGISLSDGGNVISGCLLKQIGNAETGIGAGIWLESTGALNQRIVGNIFSTMYTGIHSEGDIIGAVITGNGFENMGWGAEGYGISAVSYQSCVITANSFVNCTRGPFNKARIVQSGPYPGEIYNNVGVDVGLGALTELTDTAGQTWHPMAYFSDKFATNNAASTIIRDFFKSNEEGRRISVTLGDSNTTIAQWGESTTGTNEQLYCYSVGGGWDASNHYHDNGSFNLFGSPAVINDALYVSCDDGGYQNARRVLGLKLNIGTASTGNTVVAEYWDGFAWITLPTYTAANIFANTGSQSTTWSPPKQCTYTWAGYDIVVSGSGNTFTFSNTDYTWLHPIVGQRGYVRVGDYIITSGFDETANNGKWLVTGVTRTVITVADPGNILVNETHSATVKQAGWCFANLNAIGPGTPPSSSGYWMRFRVSIAAGGQCVISGAYPQYNYIHLEDGDFGPSNNQGTIYLKSFNGAFVEESRTSI